MTALWAALLLSATTVTQGRLLRTDSPPRGWNSYDAFGTSTEAQTMATADSLTSQLLLDSGYNYLTIDAGWFGRAPPGYGAQYVDGYGRPIPSPSLYPSANGSFKPLSSYVHSKGFKFGVWYMGGLPSSAVHNNLPIKGTNYTARDLYLNATYCPRWDTGWGYEINHQHPAAQPWYESLVELWAEWGVDFVKADCINAEDESTDHRMDIIRMHDAFESSQRDFVFSLSPGGFSNISQLREISPYASMARVTDDFWDNWGMYMNQGGASGWSSGSSHWDAARDLVAAVQNTQPTFWIDMDMLPFGRIGHLGVACSPVGPGCPRHTRFTTEEQNSVMSLWAMVQAPLILGGDVRDGMMDALTVELVTQAHVLDMSQSILEAREAYRLNTTQDGYVVWQASSRQQNKQFVAVFNLLDTTRGYEIPLRSLGLTEGARWTNLWNVSSLVSFVSPEVLNASCAAHGVFLASVEV